MDADKLFNTGILGGSEEAAKKNMLYQIELEKAYTDVEFRKNARFKALDSAMELASSTITLSYERDLDVLKKADEIFEWLMKH